MKGKEFKRKEVGKMKKIKYGLFFILAFMAFTIKSNAVCYDQSLIDAAKEVTYDYNVHPDNGLAYQILYHNITDSLYATILSSYDDSLEEYHYKDLKDNALVYATLDTDKKVTYTVNIYSDTSVCFGELLHTLTFETPILNRFYGFTDCLLYPMFDLCQKNIDTLVDIDKFNFELERYKAAPPVGTLDNPYYDREECKKIKEYELCQQKVSLIVDEDVFVSLATRYKWFVDYEDSLRKPNYLLIIISVASPIVVGAIAIIVVKKTKKGRGN